MKEFIIFIIVVGLFSLGSWLYSEERNTEVIREYDECEYIIFYSNSSSTILGVSHKGNCKNKYHKKWGI